MNYGGFWIRFLAYMVDFAIVMVIMIAITAGTAMLGDFVAFIGSILSLLIALLYWPVLTQSSRQATFGKALMGLKVTGPDGGKISFLRALVREIPGKIISSAAFMLGYLLIAFTGKKQGLHDFIASTTVVRADKGYVIVGVAATVFVFVAPAVAVMMFGEAALTRMMGGMMADAQKEAPKAPAQKPAAATPAAPAAPTAPTAAAPAEAKPAAAPAPAAPGPAPAEIEALFNTKLTGIDQPGTTRAGPVVLALDSFFTGSFWIKVHLAPVKQFDGRALVVLSRVADKANAELYDPKNSLEGPFFQRVSFTPESKPVPHLSGTRQVSLKKGARSAAVERVEGTVKLSVPTRTASLNFTSANVGKPQTAYGNTLTLKSIEGRDVEFGYQGDGKRFLLVRAYGTGKQVGQLAMSVDPGEQQVRLAFSAPVARVEAVVAEDLVEREFPFTLSRTSTADPTAVAATPRSLIRKPKPEPEKPGAIEKPGVEEQAKPELAPEARADTPKPAARVEPLTPPFAGPVTPGPRFNDLVTAVLYRDADTVKQLLLAGKWPDKADSQGMTPLAIAVDLGDAAIAEALLRGGADPGRAMTMARTKNSPLLSLLERYSKATP